MSCSGLRDVDYVHHVVSVHERAFRKAVEPAESPVASDGAIQLFSSRTLRVELAKPRTSSTSGRFTSMLSGKVC